MGVVTDLIRGLRTSPKVATDSATALLSANQGKVGKSNVQLFRLWSKNSEWVRAAINVRKTQISSAEWDIVPFDNSAKAPSKTLQREIRDLFNQPNATTDSFRSFIEPVVEDILTLDAGCVEKDRSLDGHLRQLWPVDGGTIKVSAVWDGDPKEPRYFWYPGWQEKAAFLNDNFIYIMGNPVTWSVLGISPLEVLKNTIDSILSADEYNVRQVRSAAPDGMIDLGEGARPDQLNSFRNYWLSEIAGKGAMAFIGGTRGAKFIPFRSSNRDMQYLEWQTFLVRKVAAVYQISPQDLGVTFDINRSTGEVQQENTEDRGLRPLLALVQDYLTREVVWDRSLGGRANNLAFRFTRLNLKETTSKAAINKQALAGVPWKTVNEARKDEGRETLGPEFDKLIMSTPVGAVSLDEIPTASEAILRNRAQAPAGEPGRAASQSTPPER